MNKTIKPLGDRVVAVADEAQAKTASGIILPDSAKEKSKVAVVKSVGPTAKDIKVGDKILYREYSPTEVKLENIDYIILKEEDVLAIVSE